MIADAPDVSNRNSEQTRSKTKTKTLNLSSGHALYEVMKGVA